MADFQRGPEGKVPDDSPDVDQQLQQLLWEIRRREACPPNIDQRLQQLLREVRRREAF